MKKYLFLDIDGVLNSQDWYNSDECADLVQPNIKLTTSFHFDPAAIELLNDIVLATECEIVISSSWRKGRNVHQLQDILREVGFRHPGKIIGTTDSSYNWLKPGVHCPSIRGLEIKVWLDLNVRKTKKGFTNDDFTYCILDDDTDMLYEQKDNFVNTNPQVGLTPDDNSRAIKILNTQL